MPTSNMTNSVWLWRSLIGTLFAAMLAGAIGGVRLGQAVEDHIGNALRHMTVADAGEIKESIATMKSQQEASTRDVERIERRQEKISDKLDDVEESIAEGNKAILEELRRQR